MDSQSHLEIARLGRFIAARSLVTQLTGRHMSTRPCTLASSRRARGMQMVISVPDDPYAGAERLSRALKKSRGRFCGDAARQ